MPPATIFLIMLAFFSAAFLKGVTGLGFATLCLGLLASFFDIRMAVPLVFLPSLTSNFLVMHQAGRFRESLRRFWPLFLSTLPGLLLGMWLLSSGSSAVTKTLLGLVLICYGLWGLCFGVATLSKQAATRLMLPVGVVTGFINGATGSQIMPILPYLMALQLDRNLFVQAINSAFTFSTLVMIIGLGKVGILTWPVLLLSSAGIIPVALGIWLGGLVRNGVSEALYRKLVLLLLIGIGANLAVRSLVG